MRLGAYRISQRNLTRQLRSRQPSSTFDLQLPLPRCRAMPRAMAGLFVDCGSLAVPCQRFDLAAWAEGNLEEREIEGRHVDRWFNREQHAQPDLGWILGPDHAIDGFLGMELGDEARIAMHEHMRAKQASESVRHIHTTAGFGVDPDEIRERFASYCLRFDLL